MQLLWESDFKWDADHAMSLSAGPALYWRWNDHTHIRIEWKHDFISDVNRHAPDHGNGDRLSGGIRLCLLTTLIALQKQAPAAGSPDLISKIQLLNPLQQSLLRPFVFSLPRRIRISTRLSAFSARPESSTPASDACFGHFIFNHAPPWTAFVLGSWLQYLLNLIHTPQPIATFHFTTFTPSYFAPSPAQRAPSSLTLRGLRANLQFTIYVLLALRPTFIL